MIPFSNLNLTVPTDIGTLGRATGKTTFGTRSLARALGFVNMASLTPRRQYYVSHSSKSTDRLNRQGRTNATGLLWRRLSILPVLTLDNERGGIMRIHSMTRDDGEQKRKEVSLLAFDGGHVEAGDLLF